MSTGAMNQSQVSRTFGSPPALTSGLLQRRCSCGAHSPGGAQCHECANAAKLRRRGGATSQSVEVPASVYDVLRSRGDALDAGERAFFEPRFGHDFGRVRVHADATAADSASAVNASAYTVGHHVVFGRGRYQPNLSSGRELLAHELAHVVQQRGASIPATGLQMGSTSSSLEASADNAASQALSGQGRVPATPGGPMLARKPDAAEKKKCPATHTFPNDIYTAMDAAWKKSGHGSDTVSEQGGRVVTDKDGKRVIRTGPGGGGSIALPAAKTGDTTLGTFHSHPYSKSEGSDLGVPFSGGDIKNFVAGKQGTFKYIAAGSCNFALDTLDSAARDGCKAVDIEKRWNDAYKSVNVSTASDSEVATKAAIKDCGLCFYKACRADEKSAIPKVANLVT